MTAFVTDTTITRIATGDGRTAPGIEIEVPDWLFQEDQVVKVTIEAVGPLRLVGAHARNVVKLERPKP